MTMTSLIRSCALVLLTTAVVSAQGPVTTLPEFTVAQLDGQSLSSSAIAREGHWVLVYVEPRCVSCHELLAFLRADDDATVASRTVVIVGRATADEARELAATAPHLASASWYVDSGVTVATALRANGAPITFGLRDHTIAWTTRGALPMVRDVVMDWLSRLND